MGAKSRSLLKTHHPVFKNISQDELIDYLSITDSYRPKMQYDYILLAKGPVRIAGNLFVFAGSVISQSLVLPRNALDGTVANICLVVIGDLDVECELSLDDGQGLIVLGDIRSREFVCGDGELFAKTITASRYISIDVLSGGLITLESAQAPIVLHDSGYWTPPFKIVSERQIAVGKSASPPLVSQYENGDLCSLTKALRAGLYLWAV